MYEITISEQHRLTELESVIQEGLQTFIDVGIALAEIRDSRLYRQEYDTFEDYCNDKWGMTRRHINRTIKAAEIAMALGPIGPKPQLESQVRPLTSLEPEEQIAVWQTAVETAPNGKVTAAHVNQVKQEYLYPHSNGQSLTPGPIEENTREDLGPLVQEPTSKPHVSHNSGNNEWYTPAEIVEAARATMGEINLDPASSELANTVIKAADYLTAEDNGLDRDWYGNVWLNPPYSSDLIGKFCEKLHGEFIDGHITSACVLVNNATETGWFRLLVSIASAICFPSRRVAFWKPEGDTGQPLQGQAVLYIGPDIDAFLMEFSHIGFIVEVLSE